MKIPRRIKFIWGASKVIRGQWFLGVIGLYDRHEGKREDGFVVSVRGLLLWGGVLAFLGWVALATAGFWIWQRNPYTLLTYTDALLYPWRQSAITEKKGQAFIAQGLDLARAGRWYDAANLLRLGLARHPRDFRARLTLARFYQLTNQSAAGLKVLTDGLGDERRAILDTSCLSHAGAWCWPCHDCALRRPGFSGRPPGDPQDAPAVCADHAGYAARGDPCRWTR